MIVTQPGGTYLVCFVSTHKTRCTLEDPVVGSYPLFRPFRDLRHPSVGFTDGKENGSPLSLSVRVLRVKVDPLDNPAGLLPRGR